ncbi:CHAP domain-containing protein [Gemmiger sp.]|uniref:C40 family peptidase n=1 Tax=Gemmiger sp. TaxID=2049027 RepID=UPI003AB423B7
MIKEPRLRFTEEERADPALEKPIRKAEKAAAKADKVQAKIPKKQVKRAEVDPKTGKVTTKLVLEDKPRPPSKLSHTVRDAPGNAVAGKLHQEIRKTEDDNVGVESAHKSEEAVETGVHLVREGYRSHKLKPYRKAAQAERKLEKANIEALFQKSVYENHAAASNPLSRWQQKQQIKKQHAAAKRAAQSGGSAAGAAQKTGKAAKTVKEKAQQAGAYVMRHKKGFGIVLAIFLLVCLLLNTMSSCSMMAQSIGSAISGTTYPSDDPELVAVEADYAAKEAALQAEIDNIESSHPGYDEYRYDLDMIGHDPHELAAYLSAVLQGYTRASAQAELERIFAAQYQLTLTEEVEVRYRTETRTDSEGNEYDVEVPYNYYILNVTLTSKPISSVASELLTPDQLEMYQVYRQTLGNKPLIFGGGSADTSDSESLAGVEFVNGTRPGNQAVVDIAKSQVGNVGGQPYWSWYGFTSRVEWCACFVSWCYGQMGLSEPRFAACQSQGIPWFQSHGQWGGRDYANIAPGDAIFFDWDLDGSADHVGIVVGTDGSRVYTVEGNSGDACKIKSYSLTYECIKGYGLMNW